MWGNWKRISKLMIAGFLIVIPFLYSARGDGCVFYGEESLEFLLEEDQYAMIDYEEGIQKMLIKIDIEKKDVSNSTWILPIPSSHDLIGFDIEANMLVFRGQNIKKAYEEQLEEYKKELLSMYYSSFLPGLRFFYLWSSSFTDEAHGSLDGTNGVYVHERIEFHGINSELVSTDNPIALIEYLNEKGLPIQMGSLDSFDYYIENDFSFIITWINSNSLEGLTPALYVQFPTSKIYYPMLLTSEYGDQEVPISILINDYVEFEDGIELKEHSKLTYYRGEDFYDYDYIAYMSFIESNPEYSTWSFEKVTEEFGDLMRSHYLENQTLYSNKYTYIEINAKADKFTEDLYFKRIEPDVVKDEHRIDMANAERYLFKPERFLSFAIFSWISGAIAGLIFFRKEKPKIIISILISLLNIIAIWVFSIGSLILFRPKKKKDWFRFLGFTVVYHLIFFTFVMIFIEPLYIFI